MAKLKIRLFLVTEYLYTFPVVVPRKLLGECVAWKLTANVLASQAHLVPSNGTHDLMTQDVFIFKPNSLCSSSKIRPRLTI